MVAVILPSATVRVAGLSTVARPEPPSSATDTVYSPSAGVSEVSSVVGWALRTLTVWSYQVPLEPRMASGKSSSNAVTGMS